MIVEYNQKLPEIWTFPFRQRNYQMSTTSLDNKNSKNLDYYTEGDTTPDRINEITKILFILYNKKGKTIYNSLAVVLTFALLKSIVHRLESPSFS